MTLDPRETADLDGGMTLDAATLTDRQAAEALTRGDTLTVPVGAAKDARAARIVRRADRVYDVDLPDTDVETMIACGGDALRQLARVRTEIEFLTSGAQS